MPRWIFLMRNSSHDPHDWPFVPERQMPSIQRDWPLPRRGGRAGRTEPPCSPSWRTPPMALRAPASTTTKDPPRVPRHPCSGGFGWGGALAQPHVVLDTDWRPLVTGTANRRGTGPGIGAQSREGHTAEGEAHPLSHPSDLTDSYFIPAAALLREKPFCSHPSYR